MPHSLLLLSLLVLGPPFVIRLGFERAADGFLLFFTLEAFPDSALFLCKPLHVPLSKRHRVLLASRSFGLRLQFVLRDERPALLVLQALPIFKVLFLVNFLGDLRHEFLVGESLSDNRHSVFKQVLSDLLEDLIVERLQIHALALGRSKKLLNKP